MMQGNVPPELKAQLETQFKLVKKQLKNLSKNDLIRTVTACLVDNYVLTERLKQYETTENAEVKTELPVVEIDEANRA